MKTEETNPNHLIAEYGKVLRRISDKTIVGKEIHLGMTYYLGGILLNEPLQELPEHYEEIDEPLTDNDIVINENDPLIGEVIEVVSDEEPTGTKQTKPIVTLSDYRELEQKVELLMQMIGGKE